jgi:2-aminoadipate transaminase
MPTLSQRIPALHASPIREILAVIQQPGMISFAGGLPDPASFPSLALVDVPKELLQYGASEGEYALREQICLEMRALGLACDPAQVLVLSGSQQGIDLVAKLMVDSGSLVALENPTYLAALQVFRFFGARFVSLIPASPLTALAQIDKPRFCYVVPTFQNPSGYCYSQQERELLATACSQQDVLLFEDDPYRDLVYGPCDRQPICSLMQKGSWVYQSSFSKTLAPGLRLGFLVASPDVLPYLVRAKQAADLHSNRLSQYLVLQQLNDPNRTERVTQLQKNYRHKRDRFAEVLRAELGDAIEWELPQGGLFFWAKLRQPQDTAVLLQRALEQKVAFMPGSAFFHAGADAASYLRLNFSHANENDMQRGLAILRKVLLGTSQATQGGKS